MASSKELEAQAERKPEYDEAPPPSYTVESGDAGPSSSTAAPAPAVAASSYPQPPPPPPVQSQTTNTTTESNLTSGKNAAGPTVDSPFAFPSDAPLPPYSELPTGQKPIAIPQRAPNPTAPFVAAYAPALLAYGITDQAWHSLLDTLSAFLAAKVSDRALRHAGDMAKHAGRGGTSLVKNVAADFKSAGRDFSQSAKKGDVIGATFGAIGNGIALTIGAAVGTVAAAASLPGNTIGAAFKRPQTPRARAEAYLNVVNKDWLSRRRLRAHLLDGHDLAGLVGMSYGDLLALARGGKGRNVEEQLGALGGHFERLEYKEPPLGELGDQTLWLVVTPVEGGGQETVAGPSNSN